MTARPWRIRLGNEAERDFTRILNYTLNTFGTRQSDLYRIVLLKALAALGAGPDVPGSAARDEIYPGLRTLHVARHGWRGRRFIMYRATAANPSRSSGSCTMPWTWPGMSHQIVNS